MRWYRNEGKGSFTSFEIDTSNQQQVYDLKAVDIHGDNRLDLILAGCESRNAVLYRNRNYVLILRDEADLGYPKQYVSAPSIPPKISSFSSLLTPPTGDSMTSFLHRFTPHKIKPVVFAVRKFCNADQCHFWSCPLTEANGYATGMFVSGIENILEKFGGLFPLTFVLSAND